MEITQMSKKLFAAPLLALATLGTAQAQSIADDFTVTGTAGVYSDYRFRGESQTLKKPAFQGGFTVAHKSGFYVGNWNSNVDFDDSSIEMDIFGGYATEVAGFGVDVGVLQYYYPGGKGNDVDTTEAYAGLKYGPALLKVSYSFSDYFGAKDSDGTIYANLSISQPIVDKLSLNAAIGTRLGEKSVDDVNDYMIGLSYALPKDFTVGFNYHFNAGPAAKKAAANGSGTAIDAFGDGAVIYVSKAF